MRGNTKFNQFLFLSSSERLDVNECLRHKWLAKPPNKDLVVTSSDHQNGTNTITNGCGNVTCTIINAPTSIRLHETTNGKGDTEEEEESSVTSTMTTASVSDEDEVNEATNDSVTNVTISLVNRSMSTSNGAMTPTNATVSSTCTIGKNGLIVEELDELAHQYRGDDKENRHCTLLAMNGFHMKENGAAVGDVQLFPDAPTTPKVLRKVAPMYCSFKKAPPTQHISTTPVVVEESNGHDLDLASDVLSPRNGVTVTVTINGDDRHASTTRIHICPPD